MEEIKFTVTPTTITYATSYIACVYSATITTTTACITRYWVSFISNADKFNISSAATLVSDTKVVMTISITSKSNTAPNTVGQFKVTACVDDATVSSPAYTVTAKDGIIKLSVVDIAKDKKSIPFDGNQKTITKSDILNYDALCSSMTGTTTATEASTNTITCTLLANYIFADGNPTKPMTWEITPIDCSADFTTLADQTYTENTSYTIFQSQSISPKIDSYDKRICQVGYVKGSTGTPTNWSGYKDLKASDAGNYFLYYKIAGGTNYNDVPSTYVGLFTIKPRPLDIPTVSFNSDITFDNSDHPIGLFDSTKYTHGTLTFSADGTNYGTMPKAKTAGTYSTLYYKVSPKTNYIWTGDEITSVSGSFTIKRLRVTTPTKDKTECVYTKTSTTAVKTWEPFTWDSSHVSYKGNVSESNARSDYSVTFSLKDTNNYCWDEQNDPTGDKKFDWEIKKHTLQRYTLSMSSPQPYTGAEYNVSAVRQESEFYDITNDGPISRISPGTTYITCTNNDTNNTVWSGTTSSTYKLAFTVSDPSIEITAPTFAPSETKVYDSQPIYIIKQAGSVTPATYSMQYAVKEENATTIYWSDTPDIGCTSAGTYSGYYRIVKGTTEIESHISTNSWVINPAEMVATNPQPVAVEVKLGESQELCIAGSVSIPSGVQFQYGEGTKTSPPSTYSTSIPTTNKGIGTYYIYYKATANNYKPIISSTPLESRIYGYPWELQATPKALNVNTNQTYENAISFSSSTGEIYGTVTYSIPQTQVVTSVQINTDNTITFTTGSEIGSTILTLIASGDTSRGYESRQVNITIATSPNHTNIHIYTGATWEEAYPYVFDGSTWQPAIACIYDGNTWVEINTKKPI